MGGRQPCTRKQRQGWQLTAETDVAHYDGYHLQCSKYVHYYGAAEVFKRRSTTVSSTSTHLTTVVVAALVMLLGCGESVEETDRTTILDTTAEEMSSSMHARRTIDRLRARGLDVHIQAERYYPDGRFSHLRALWKRHGRRGVAIAVLENGDIAPLRDVDRRFASEHFSEWGILGLQSAERVLSTGAGTEQSFLIFVDRLDCDLGERLQQKFPHATIEQLAEPPVVIVRT